MDGVASLSGWKGVGGKEARQNKLKPKWGEGRGGEIKGVHRG